MGKENDEDMIGQAAPETTTWLEAIVTYLVYKSGPNQSSTKLVKLLYLCDLYHYQKHGHTLSRAVFVRGPFGPYSEAVKDVVQGLEERGILRYQPVVTRRMAGTAKVPTPLAPRVRIPPFPQEAKETLNQVLKRWGPVSPDQVTAFAKATVPFLVTARDWEQIDFSVLDPRADHQALFSTTWTRFDVSSSPTRSKGTPQDISKGQKALFDLLAPLRLRANQALLEEERP